MGAQTPPRTASEARPESLVDWCEFTTPDGVDPREVLAGWGALKWVQLKRGRLGYLNAVMCGNLRIDYDGSKDMGFHVTITGSACREAEALGMIQGGACLLQKAPVGRDGTLPLQRGSTAISPPPDWPAFFGYLVAVGAHCTRLDLAVDDRRGLLDLERICEEWDAGRCTSRWEEFDRRMPNQKGQRAVLQTLYLGTAKSACRGRIYDKAHEQGLPAGEHWVRAELQLRRERADRAMRALAERSPDRVGAFIAGLWKAYLRFVVPTSTRLERCPTAAWWAAFLGEVAAVRLGSRPDLVSPAAAQAWLAHACGPWIATITLWRGGDVGWIYEILRSGRERMNDRQRAMLAQAA